MLEDYKPRLKKWYDRETSDEHKQSANSTDKLQMEQWLRVCQQPEGSGKEDMVGIWSCHRESDVTGDPACRTKYECVCIYTDPPPGRSTFMINMSRPFDPRAAVDGYEHYGY